MSSRSSAAPGIVVGFALVCSLAAASLVAQSTPVTPPASLAELHRDLDLILASPALNRGFWGILVRDVDRDETLYARNADKLMMPASTMKIVTLAAAAEKLGWDHTFATRVFPSGSISEGVLHGDLIVVGGGDPNFDDWDGVATRVFAEWAAQLKAAGIITIDGKIVGDDNLFDDEGLGLGWSWDDVASSFSANISALQFNQGSVQLHIAPGRAIGSKAVIALMPEYGGLRINNRITTGAPGSPAVIVRRRLPGASRLDLRGSVPLRMRPFSETASVENPTLYYVNALKRALVAGGIEVRGSAVDIDDLDSPPAARTATPLVSYNSPPLSVIATTMMKLSQNLYAETLLKTLGIDSTDPPAGTALAGVAAIRSVLQGWDIDPTGGLIQTDGSGLSRYNYITPELMVAILTHVEQDQRLKGAFEATLPIAGRDGTLEGRMRGTIAEGNARAKTGSMTNVRSMAGYVKGADGDTLAFAIFANNYENSSSVINAASDAIVVRLAGYQGH
jgi:D-alanyl-D-alanine carboxypeptidase/D-alanyl-D-alanine-endopeptidase (penicillin-binding protein 4)